MMNRDDKCPLFPFFGSPAIDKRTEGVEEVWAAERLEEILGRRQRRQADGLRPALDMSLWRADAS